MRECIIQLHYGLSLGDLTRGISGRSHFNCEPQVEQIVNGLFVPLEDHGPPPWKGAHETVHLKQRNGLAKWHARYLEIFRDRLLSESASLWVLTADDVLA